MTEFDELLKEPVGERGLASQVALHEAAHVTVNRYYDAPISVATIVPSSFFAGIVRGPGSKSDTPDGIIAAAAEVCDEARALMPPAGASLLPVGAGIVVALVAGVEGERLAGFDAQEPKCDLQQALIYAASICGSDEAIAAFINFCRAEARGILRERWHAVRAIATALDERKPLTGSDIDLIIANAEQRAAHEAELRPRERMAAMTARAKEFAREAL